MLLFEKKFLAAIRSGVKTQTIRLWKHRKYRAGQRSYIPGVGYITIDEVELISPEELTQDDALRDGFPDLASLIAEIDRIYPQRDDLFMFRLRFRVLPPEEQAAAKAEKEAKKRL